METIKSKNTSNILKLCMYLTGVVGFVDTPSYPPLCGPKNGSKSSLLMNGFNIFNKDKCSVSFCQFGIIWYSLVLFKQPLQSHSIFIIKYQKMETIKSKNTLNILKLCMYITGVVGFVDTPSYPPLCGPKNGSKSSLLMNGCNIFNKDKCSVSFCQFGSIWYSLVMFKFPL